MGHTQTLGVPTIQYYCTVWSICLPHWIIDVPPSSSPPCKQKSFSVSPSPTQQSPTHHHGSCSVFPSPRRQSVQHHPQSLSPSSPLKEMSRSVSPSSIWSVSPLPPPLIQPPDVYHQKCSSQDATSPLSSSSIHKESQRYIILNLNTVTPDCIEVQ